jgi:hypothetical protein
VTQQHGGSITVNSEVGETASSRYGCPASENYEISCDSDPALLAISGSTLEVLKRRSL